MKPSVVLAIGAHPDDMDFSAGGTLASFASQGAAVYYLQLTNGCCGTTDRSITPEQLTAVRRDEQLAACACINGHGVTFLDHRDGSLEVTQDVKRQIVREIRIVRPDVVITMDPSMLYATEMGIINHPDHRAAGQATLDAVYPLARDYLAFPDMQDLEPHNVKTVLMWNLNNQNYYHDITDTFETKLAMVRAHNSQVQDYNAMRELFTNMAQKAGQAAGCTYAEAFVRIDIA